MLPVAVESRSGRINRYWTPFGGGSIRPTEIPTKKTMIYKYIDKWGINVLTEKRIKITHPNDFNDPFEFLPQMVEKITMDQVDEKLGDPLFQDNYYKEKLSKGEVRNRTDFNRWLKANKKALRSAMFQAYANSDYTAQDFADIAGKRFGVSCFSDNPDDILMWSHYADKHRGMVIGFEGKTFGPYLYKADYDHERHEYHPVFTTGRSDAIINTLRRKSKHWKYEAESRLIIPWIDCVKETHKDKDTGNTVDLWFHQVDPCAVRRVIVGAKVSPAFIDDIRAVISADYPWVIFDKMSIDPKRYALNVSPA